LEKWIALLGKRNTPTDGVEDYCTFLGQALSRRGIELEQVRVPWEEKGWDAALDELGRRASDWRDRWVFFQHTALAWSRRGFPFGALQAVKALKRSGARIGVVFHEYREQDEAASAVRPVRAACQNYVIRALHARSALSVLTSPTERIPWLAKDCAKAVSIPIGANVPAPRKRLRCFVFRQGTTRNWKSGIWRALCGLPAGAASGCT